MSTLTLALRKKIQGAIKCCEQDAENLIRPGESKIDPTKHCGYKLSFYDFSVWD